MHHIISHIQLIINETPQYTQICTLDSTEQQGIFQITAEDNQGYLIFFKDMIIFNRKNNRSSAGYTLKLEMERREV